MTSDLPLDAEECDECLGWHRWDQPCDATARRPEVEGQLPIWEGGA